MIEYYLVLLLFAGLLELEPQTLAKDAEASPPERLSIHDGEPECGFNEFGMDYTDLLELDLEDKYSLVKKKFKSTKRVSWKEPVSELRSFDVDKLGRKSCAEETKKWRSKKCSP